MKKLKTFFFVAAMLQIIISAQVKTPPNWSVNPAQFQFSSSITAKVRYNNQAVTSGANLLAAFAGTELRGVASPVMYNSEQIYFLTAYSNSNSEQLTFKEYFYSVDTVVSLTEVQTIEPNGNYGSLADPLILNGYYHFDHSPILVGIPNQIIQTGQSFYQINLVDYLKEVDGNSIAWSFSGNSQLSISIDANHIATVNPPSGTWTGSELIRFRATDVTSAALYAEDTVLFQVRALDHSPKFSSIASQKTGQNSDFAELNLKNFVTEADGDSLAWSYAFDETGANDPVPTWSVNPESFSSSMSVTAEVTSMGQPGTGGNNILAAFSNGIVRGVASPVKANGKWLYYLTVFSNNSGDTISFRFYDAAGKKNIPVDKKLLFSINGTYGNPGIPFAMYAGNLQPLISPQGMLSVKKTDPLWTGTEQIKFMVQDVGTLHTYWDTTTTSFTVFADHTPLVTGIPNQSVQKGKPFSQFALNNYLVELDGDNVTWSYSASDHLQITIGAGSIVSVIANDSIWTGSEKIIFRVTDQTTNALFSEATVAFTVTPKDNPPHVLAIPAQVTGSGGAFNSLDLQSYLVEADGDSVSWRYSFDSPTSTDPDPQWTINPKAFEYSMTMVAEVKSLNNFRTGNAHKLAAFSGAEGQPFHHA